MNYLTDNFTFIRIKLKLISHALVNLITWSVFKKKKHESSLILISYCIMNFRGTHYERIGAKYLQCKHFLVVQSPLQKRISILFILQIL